MSIGLTAVFWSGWSSDPEFAVFVRLAAVTGVTVLVIVGFFLFALGLATLQGRFKDAHNVDRKLSNRRGTLLGYGFILGACAAWYVLLARLLPAIPPLPSEIGEPVAESVDSQYIPPDWMSTGELIVTGTAVFLGPLLWTIWLLLMSRLQTHRYARISVTAMALVLVACVGLLFGLLTTGASGDVVMAPRYLFMYVVLGMAWLRVSEVWFTYVGLSARDDVFERGNMAAAPPIVGALIAVTLCYAGGNIGDGPGWWVVVFSAGLATLTLMLAWVALIKLTAVTDTVTIDRDPSAGLRLGAFLVAGGLVLGRAVAGDWHSALAAVVDFAAALPAMAVIFILAVVIERRARPTSQRPRAPLIAFGLLPAALYIGIAIVTVWQFGWPA